MATRTKSSLGLDLPSAGSEELIPWIERKREQGKALMPETQMKLNLAFVQGHQWLVWDNHIRTYRRPRVDVNDPNAPVRITANKIGGIVERTVAKLTKNAPIPEARPVSDDDMDVSAARVATRILTHELDRLDYRFWLVSFLFWPTTLGHSYAHVRWNPDAGEEVGEDEEGMLYEGEIELEIVPAFELAVDPNAKFMSQAKYATRSSSMTRDAVYEQWGVKVEPQEAARSLAMEVNELSNEGSPGGADNEFVMVHQFWIVPCRMAPKGAVVTYTGDQLLEYQGEYPYDHKKLPFVQCDLIPGLGTREGRTWVNDLIPMQTDYNDARSREATIRRTLTPKILVSAGGMDPQRMTSRVEVLTYNPTGPEPKLFTPDGSWMNQFEQGMQRADAEMGERAGQGDVSQGNAPAGTPAAAILALQEADDTKLAVSATALASFVVGLGDQILALCRQFWTEERTVRVWSEENVLEAKRYSGADITHKLDIHVSSESALPRSKSARVQLLFELQARMPDLIDPQTLVRALDLPGVDFIVRSLDLDTRKQSREIMKLIEGEACEVQPWDNHLVHLKGLNDFRKTTDYENLRPDQQANIDAHAAVHEGLVLRQMGVQVPTTPVQEGAMETAEAVGQGRAGGVGVGGSQYLDPLTGKPPNPLAVASGQAPSALTGSTVAKRAGIGASGQPGRVPGVPVDNQAASMGS